MTHPILSRELAADQRGELVESKRVLERELGTEVPVVAYPNGTGTDYDERSIAAAEGAGYRAGLTCRFGWNDSRTSHFELRRVLVDPGSGGRGLVRAFTGPIRAWTRNRVRSLADRAVERVAGSRR